MWYRGIEPLGNALALIQMFRSDLPAIEKIWKYSALSGEIASYLTLLQRFEEAACAGVIEGDFTPESPAVSLISIGLTDGY